MRYVPIAYLLSNAASIFQEQHWLQQVVHTASPAVTQRQVHKAKGKGAQTLIDLPLSLRHSLSEHTNAGHVSA